ncbi:MAG: ABC transporter [Planctomycetota bacterium]|nr:MAG: ABC transporter [Planctomycetota bacterium]
MDKRHIGSVGLGVAVVLFVALNAVGGALLKRVRLDLTEDQLFTLSQGTRNILADIDEPIRLSFYFSRSLTEEVPEISGYAIRVEELLQEYVLASGGALELRVVDPASFSVEEDEAVASGVQGVSVSAAGDLFYFGLVATNATDVSHVIPFFDPNQEAFLEYELSRFVHDLSHPEKARLAILSALPIVAGPPPTYPGAPPPATGWYLLEQLRQAYEVELLAADASAVPAGTDVLLVVHPKDLSQGSLYAIDQFVLGGGRALVLVDPHCEDDRPPADPGNPLAGMGTPRASDLAPLLEAWGVGYDPARLLGDRAAAMYVQAGSQARPERTPYVVWLELTGDCLDQQDPVTSGLGAVRVASAGMLEPLDGASTRFTPLIRSTEEAAELETSAVQFFPQPKDLLASFAPAGQRYTLAARVTGEVLSAFPDGPPDAAAEAGSEGPPARPPEHLAASVAPLHVIIVADVDLGADRWWVQFQNFFGSRLPVPVASNGDFLLNAVDSLAGSTDLLEVRGRGRSDRPFVRIEQLRREAEQRYLAEEQRLQQELRDTERRINELQSQREETASLVLTPAQAAEIERFQESRVETRKKLRAVKHELGKEIEQLQNTLMFANTLGVPLVLLLLALGARWARGRARNL